jgi:hypothetical protein
MLLLLVLLVDTTLLALCQLSLALLANPLCDGCCALL